MCVKNRTKKFTKQKVASLVGWGGGWTAISCQLLLKTTFFVKIVFRQMTHEVCDQICQGCKTQECPQEVLQKCGCGNGMKIYW